MFWNYLDLVMVTGGILNLWLIPLVSYLTNLVGGIVLRRNEGLRQVSTYLKVMRLLRVLRLIRLMREVEKLHTLLLGVVESLKAMQYVLALTGMLLYAGAIMFTSLVGKGDMYQGEPPPGAEERFGTTAKSLFSLFKLMNSDVSVLSAVGNSLVAQVLLVLFMIVANWAIVAILTSVVSDNMRSATIQRLHEKEAREKEDKLEENAMRVRAVFEEIDTDHSGVISEQEWKQMLSDQNLTYELCDATQLDVEDLEEIFHFLAFDEGAATNARKSTRGSTVSMTSDRFARSHRVLAYSVFMKALRSESEPATKRSILHVLQHMRAMEAQLSDLKRRIRDQTGMIAVNMNMSRTPSEQTANRSK
jgi:hypothetical protein